MNATERHAVYQIRVDLKNNKDPLGTIGRKRTSEVAALQLTVEELSARVGHYSDNRSEYDRDLVYSMALSGHWRKDLR